jgi:CBS domain-containing protein
VPTALPQTPVADLLNRLVSSQLRRLVVVNEQGRILGVVTDADLVARVSAPNKPGVLAILAQSLGLSRPPTGSEGQLESSRRNARTAGELMSRKVVTVGPEEPLDGVVKLMVAHRVKFLPVQDLDGKLLGVVLRRDVLRAVTESLE